MVVRSCPGRPQLPVAAALGALSFSPPDVAVVLAIDAGTTGIRTIAVDERSPAAPRSPPEFPQHFPQPGWVEHDADDIWAATLATLAEVAAALAHGETVAAIGITNQRETTVVWDRATGRPRHRAIVWQDRRTAARCDELRAAGHEPLVRARTGLVLDPYFSGDQARVAPPRGRRRRRRRARVRHRRQLDPVAADRRRRRRRPRDRPVEREPHDAVRHRRARLVARAARPVRRSARRACRACCRAAGDFGASDPACAAGLAVPVDRHRRRPAGRAVRPGVLHARHDQEHLRHRLVRAREPRPGAPAAVRGPAHERRVDARRRRRRT